MIKRQQQTLSKALMEKLNEICSNLKQINIKYADLNPINICDLPLSKLERLCLTKCEIPLDWFQTKNKSNNFLKFIKLDHIDLSGSSRVSKTHLDNLCKLFHNSNKLLYLSLNNCYRIDDYAIDILILNSNSFQYLEQIHLDDTSCSIISLERILDNRELNFPKLKLVHVKNCKYLDRNLLMSNDFKTKLKSKNVEINF
jgi:hypothetical protein